MKRLVYLALVVGCSSAPELEQDARFARVVAGFSSEQACIDSQIGTDFFVNCTQDLVLCADGRAGATLTDIPGVGTYELVGSVAHVELTGYDGPPTFTFDLHAKQSPELPGANPWQERTVTSECD